MSSGHVLKDTVPGREVLTARTNAPSHFDTPQSTSALATDFDLEVTAISMVGLGKQSILILCCIFSYRVTAIYDVGRTFCYTCLAKSEQPFAAETYHPNQYHFQCNCITIEL